MVEFEINWYKKFIQSTNEKDLLVEKVSRLLEGKPKNSCLEIGLGTSPYFARKLSKIFKKYSIVEKRLVKARLPKEIELIRGDWEHIELKEKFDAIIASHVIYYFKNKKEAIEKMLKSLNPNGRIFIMVNGKSSDYGPLKFAFAKMIDSEYEFTYDNLLKLLEGKKIREYTFPSVINFNSYEELFEILRLTFDLYPEEYEKLKYKIIGYFKKNLKGNQFIIDQKIIEVTK